MRRLARAGAYSKAAAAATSDMARLSPEEDAAWAARLLPTSAHPGEALCPHPERDEGIEEGFDATARVHAVGDELRKVRFGPLSAPGPSGRRPEHLREMAGAKRHRAGKRWQRALAKFSIAAVEGRLDEEARWLLDSRLAWMAKRGSTVPRPVRIGETLRRLVSKWNCTRHAPAIRRKLLEGRQVGVGVPGACEGLIHAARALEEELAAGDAGAWLVIDLDLVNCFCHFEWPSVRRGVTEVAPGLDRWVAWSTCAPTRVQLPSGAWRMLDRGAEQGDPEGSFRSSAVLLGACQAADAAFLEAAGEEAVAVHWWYIDDGRLVVRPWHADGWLRAFDLELAKVGACRVAADGSKKSLARLLGGGAEGDADGAPMGHAVCARDMQVGTRQRHGALPRRHARRAHRAGPGIGRSGGRHEDGGVAGAG